MGEGRRRAGGGGWGEKSGLKYKNLRKFGKVMNEVQITLCAVSYFCSATTDLQHILQTKKHHLRKLASSTLKV